MKTKGLQVFIRFGMTIAIDNRQEANQNQLQTLNLRIHKMSKAKYPKITQEEAMQTLANGIQDLSGTLENWFKCREERIQAQFRLLQCCKTDEEINRFKSEGLFEFESNDLMIANTKSH